MTGFDLGNSLSRYKNSADWVGIKWIKEKTTYRVVRNEKPEMNQTFYDEGVRVEVLVDGHFGYAGTADLSTEGIAHAFEAALRQTRLWSRHKVFSFSEQHRPAEKGSYRSQVQKSLDSLSVQEMMDVLKDCTQQMKISDKIVTRLARAMIVETQIHSLGSNGGDQHQDFSIVNIDLQAVAREGSETQSRTLSFQNQMGAEAFLRHRLLPASQTAGEQALELLKAENCPSKKMQLLLAPDQMMLQIHESIGHPLELDRILGDERNYAGWSFVKPEDFGKLRYGSSLMNVTFDPHRFGELASYNFDDSGSRATKEFLIKDGVLQRALGSIESQARSGIAGVANFRSTSWNRAPIDRMANINLETGTLSLQDLISQVEYGVLMQTNKSWSIDDYRNKFQFGCERAQLIENGQIKKTLRNPNYRGKTVEFWNHLSAVGNENETFGTPTCGKGEPNQIIRVGHSSPYALFNNIEVFGGLS